MENFNELNVALKGTLWNILVFKIETIDVLKKIILNNDEDKAEVKVKKFPLSKDRILDIFIEVEAPNGTDYEIEIIGEININGQVSKIKYSDKFEVIRRGNLRMPLIKDIDEIIEQ